MLPAGADPYATIDFACHMAFLVRDRQVMPELVDGVKANPELTASLVVTLAALVDIDTRPADMLDWLGTYEGRERETARMIGALAEARQEYDEAAADTLPEVTLESIRDLNHAARLAGVQHPCGTPAGLARHYRRKQQPCMRCRAAGRLLDKATAEERALVHQPLLHPNFKPMLCDHPLVECGTLSGYDHHARRGEAPCEECTRALTAAMADVVQVVRCGTAAGYEMHRERDEKPCAACGKAIAALLTDVALLAPTKRPSCGSHAGYNAHGAAGEVACQHCRKAQTKYDARRRRRRTSQKKAPTHRPSCGSHAGYNAHGAAGEYYCDACFEGQQLYDAERHLRRAGRTVSPAVTGPDAQVFNWPDSVVADLLAEHQLTQSAEPAA
jgi:hypothetical protein